MKTTYGNLYKITIRDATPHGAVIVDAYDIAEAIAIWREFYKRSEMLIETIELVASCLISRR